MSQDFEFVALTPPGIPHVSIASAASRAGYTGVLDLQYTHDRFLAVSAVDDLAHQSQGSWGIKLDSSMRDVAAEVLARLPRAVGLVILTSDDLSYLPVFGRQLNHSSARFAVETTCLEDANAAEQAGATILIAKGNEAGGHVGEETTFVLLQRLLTHAGLPVWAQGGVGEHSVTACYTAGAKGVVLDVQLWLAAESPLSPTAKTMLSKMDGSETLCLGSELGRAFRVYYRPDHLGVKQLRQVVAELDKGEAEGSGLEVWRRAIRERVGCDEPGTRVFPVGQDAAFAAPLAKSFRTVGGILNAFRDSIASHVRIATSTRPLDAGAPLAASHGTTYPIVQGPMTRVSDTPAFAECVAATGALPFVALALMRGKDVDVLLRETKRRLGERPWGVGILGFVPPEFREPQLSMIREHRPPFALIAGGRPDQALSLEEHGILTYLHVPSPDLLRMFIDGGSRRFVFEGRECGGHVGPRSSFVLWEQMIAALLQRIDSGVPAADLHVLFAAGIHDARSAAMVATMAARLVERQVKIGVLLGTAYLFTKEAVTTGAILERYQEEAVRCQRTVLLETGPGHATRCAHTPYVDVFTREKLRLTEQNTAPDDLRGSLEQLNLGRLRIASKGRVRKGAAEQSVLVTLTEAEQEAEGLYMIGQIAALRDSTCTMAELHRDVAIKATEWLAGLSPSRSPAQETGSRRKSADIAIIGVSCLLPKACDAETYWENILQKVNAISEIPPERWDWRTYFDADPKAPDKVYSKWGGFVDDVFFDPVRFGIPPSSLRSIEPAQLLTLEVTRAALGDAGYIEREFPHDRTSIILGVGGGIADLGQQYAIRSALPLICGDGSAENMRMLPEWTEDSFAGILLNVTAGRVANRFNFGGVNYTVDAACASSLAAVYLAVRELQDETSDMVIVGGVDTVQSPLAYLCFSKTGALSPRGQCRTFDESADGIVISEGLAMIVLKRLADAERDCDRIYAVIRGVAGSSDGREKSLTAPSPQGQILALQRAYAHAGISPATVQLIEAHGTGTVAGDHAEIEALRHVFEAAGAPLSGCGIGSVKSMIGHTKCAAGMAGLIKVALALYNKTLPPTAGVERPNPKARFAEGPFYVNTETRPWVARGDCVPRRAGVSSFGFGGTNFHAVVEEYAGNRSTLSRNTGRERWSSELLVWHGASRAELVAGLTEVERWLGGSQPAELGDVACRVFQLTGNQRGNNGNVGLALGMVATSIDDLRQKLTRAQTALVNGSPEINDPRGIYFSERTLAAKGKIAFLFPGQGSQYVNMLREISVVFPEIREEFDAANRVLRPALGQDLSDYVFPPPFFSSDEERKAAEALTKTNIAQPAIGAAGLGMFALLRSFGLQPDMVAGHSYGEYVALAAARVMQKEYLYLLSEIRGRLIVEAAGADLGTMAAVDADRDAVLSALDGIADVWVANRNAPQQTIISGRDAAVQEASRRFAQRGVSCRPLRVACAFHSPVVATAGIRLFELLSEARLYPPLLDVFSNTTADVYPRDPAEIPGLLAEHLRKQVDFVSEIEAMYAAGARVFIEAGPQNVLTNLTSQILGNNPHLAMATDMRDRAGLLQLHHALGKLAGYGVPVQLERLFTGRHARESWQITTRNSAHDQPVSPTAWLVNGSRSWPTAVATKSATPAGVEKRPSAPPREKSASVPHTSPDLLDNRGRSAPSSYTDEADFSSGNQKSLIHETLPLASEIDARAGMILRYQNLMQRFLQQQQQVMLAYLGAAEQDGIAFADNPSDHQQQPLVPPHVEVPASDQVAQMPATTLSNASSDDAPVAVSKATGGFEAFAAALVRIISDRTGYPPDMIGRDVELEADLGINSIKKVEILSALQQSCTEEQNQYLRQAMDRLVAAKTLQAILNGIEESFGAAEKPSPREQTESRLAPADDRVPVVEGPGMQEEDFQRKLLEIVSERTGYPAEMLDLNADIEADLGINSIKRVEILSSFHQSCGENNRRALQQTMDQLATRRTLRAIVELISTTCRDSRHATGSIDNAVRPTKARESEKEGRAVSAVPRYRLECADGGPAAGSVHAHDGVVLITDDGRGVASSLAEELRVRRAQVVLVGHKGTSKSTSTLACDFTDSLQVAALLQQVRNQYGAIGGLIHLLPLRNMGSPRIEDSTNWREQLQIEVKSLFILAQGIQKELSGSRHAFLLAASAMGGRFGLDESRDTFFAGHAAIGGLLKTFVLENPEIRCRVIDVDPGYKAEVLSSWLLEELGDVSPEVAVGRVRSGRVFLRPVEAKLSETDGDSLHLDSESVVLITGGARGVCAALAGELARRYRPRLILLGRSPLPPEAESPTTAGVEGIRELKSRLIAEFLQKGPSPSLPQIEAAYAALVREREIRTTLLSIQKAGRVKYVQCDVRDDVAVRDLLDDIYREFGRIDGIIHGAGIIEDKLIAEKAVESFDRVFDTKVDGAISLIRYVRPESLKFFAFMSSVAGLFGNRGQVDYAAANEVLNSLALAQDRVWEARVVSMNWGPWAETGMAEPEVRAQFTARGVHAVPTNAGQEAFLSELCHGRKGEVVLIYGRGPWESALAPTVTRTSVCMPLVGRLPVSVDTSGRLEFSRVLDPAFDIYLRDHQLDALPVMPAAIALELMAEVVQQGWPDWQIVRLDGFRVLSGVILKNGPMRIRVLASSKAQREAPTDELAVNVSIGDMSGARDYYRANVILARTPTVQPIWDRLSLTSLQPFPTTVSDAYEQMLFHGPSLRRIASIDGINRDRIVATLRPSLPREFLRDMSEQSWLLDPGIVDCIFQLAILWSRVNLKITPLPSRFQSFRPVRPLNGRQLVCDFRATSTNGNQVLADAALFDSAGQLLAVMEAAEFTGNSALNRLSTQDMRQVA